MFSCRWIMMLMTVLMKYDADEMRCMQLTRSKDKGRGDEPENGGPAIYLQLTLVQENMEWKRKWKWTLSGKESESEHGVKKKLDFFCRYFVFSIGQMAKLSNDGPLRIGLIEYQEVDQSRPKDRSKKIFEKHKIKHISR